VLLVVPLAIVRPRFGVLWVVPIAMWLLPPGTSVAGWQFALAWMLVGACVLAAFREGLVGRWPAGHRPQVEHPSSLATTG